MYTYEFQEMANNNHAAVISVEYTLTTDPSYRYKERAGRFEMLALCVDDERLGLEALKQAEIICSCFLSIECHIHF